MIMVRTYWPREVSGKALAAGRLTQDTEPKATETTGG